MKPRVKIEDIEPLKDSFQVPEGYFDVLADRINKRKDEKLPPVKLEDISALDESYQAPEGYFDSLAERIEQRKNTETPVAQMNRSNKLIWRAAAVIAFIFTLGVLAVRFNPEPDRQKFVKTGELNISDDEIATLLNERDDEFELTEDEIMEVIEYETLQDESTAIINYLKQEQAIDNN